MSDIERVTVADGKYTVVIDGGKLTALRHGEPWRDLWGAHRDTVENPT